MKINEQSKKVLRKNIWEMFHDKDFTWDLAWKIRNLARGGGFCTRDAYHLFSLARQIPDGGVYLEIGSWRGASLTCAFLGTKIAKKTVNFIAIEPAIQQRFLDNTKLIPNLKIMKAKSDTAQHEINDNTIDLLFIDGNHSYLQAKRDLENYWPKIKAGGILLGHDYFTRGRYFGVKRAADEFFGIKTRIISLKPSHCYKVQK